MAVATDAPWVDEIVQGWLACGWGRPVVISRVSVPASSRAADEAAGLVGLPKREGPPRVVPALPWSAYRVMVG